LSSRWGTPDQHKHFLPLFLNLTALGNILECNENMQRMLFYSYAFCGESKVLTFKKLVGKLPGSQILIERTGYTELL
jgi:hypothetical protein